MQRYDDRHHSSLLTRLHEAGLECLSTVNLHCLSMAAALLISSPCRLHAAKDKAEARRRAALYAADHPIDPATGRPFFHPQTGRAPEARNKQGMPVGTGSTPSGGQLSG